MFRNTTLLAICLLLIQYGCIEEYYPDQEDLRTGMLVVVAHLDNGPGIQTITLSQSVDLKNTAYHPVTDCYVVILRADNAKREFVETEPGTYTGSLDASFMRTGDSYKLAIVTPAGRQYESEYEKLYPAPDIESVYFSVEEHQTADPMITESGIQFYIDFEIEKDSGRYLQWVLSETYELRNPDNPTRVYGTDRRWRDVPGEEKMLACWITQDIPSIYTLDLGNVDGEVYRRMPLNYVSNQSRRLYERYSLMIRQLSLSEEAFWYWNELRKNVQSMGGLFDKQPAITPSNICNVDDEEELVIGYFSISGCAWKRVFVENVPGLDVTFDPAICAPGVMPMFIWRYPEFKLPLYVVTSNIYGITETGEVSYECVDCREYKNSTHIKPDFW